MAFGGGADIGYSATQLDFYTAPNTTTPIGNIRIRVTGAGNVGIGTVTPTEKLEVVGNVRANAFLMPSSRELKADIAPLGPDEYRTILEQINGLELVRFRYRNDERRTTHLGVIAEEAPRQILDSTGRAVSLSEYTNFLTAALKAQSAEIESLKARQAAEIEALKAQIRALEVRLSGKGTP